MSLNFSKINKKIIIRQKSSLLSSYSNRNFKNNNILNLTPKSFNSEDKADEYILDLVLKNNGYELFNDKYELAWKEIAPYLD